MDEEAVEQPNGGAIEFTLAYANFQKEKLLLSLWIQYYKVSQPKPYCLLYDAVWRGQNNPAIPKSKFISRCHNVKSNHAEKLIIFNYVQG